VKSLAISAQMLSMVDKLQENDHYKGSGNNGGICPNFWQSIIFCAGFAFVFVPEVYSSVR
jgi:hypothetical protein